MNMYRPGNPAHRPTPFGSPPPHRPPFRFGGACSVPPPGLLSPVPFSTVASESHFLLNKPSRGHFVRPHCSSFSTDHSTVIALEGRQQISPPAEPRQTQVPQWNPIPVKHHLPDSSDQAGEEFLRCIAANKPLPDYLKGNMAYNLADAFQSASFLKEAVRLDPEFRKRVTRSKSRSRSQSRSKSRGRSRAKSRARSKSRVRSRSRGRAKSHARCKSRARSKSRTSSLGRSRSRSRKSHLRSKSQVRRSRTRSSSGEKSHGKDKKRKRSPSYSYGSSNHLTGHSLLEGLKLVMNSKELEERLPTLKDAILTIQASDEKKKVECVPDEPRHQQHYSLDSSTSLENDNMLLPHDRVGSDFSWLQARSREDPTVQKADELEDEESFLYGSEDIGKKQTDNSSATLFAAFSQIGEREKPREMESLVLGSQQHHQNKFINSSCKDLIDLKQPLQINSLSLTSANLDSSECEKIKNILKSLGTADISEIMVKMQEQEAKQLSAALLSSDSTAASLALPALSDPKVRQSLESLQSLIKATKEKRARRDGSCTSQTSSDKHKAGDNEEKKREKQARMTKMESLMKELEGLLKHDGFSFMTPVIGFYCQKCEEFIGDLNSAENHAAIHYHSGSSSEVQMDQHTGDGKLHLHSFSSSSNQHPHPSDRRDPRDYSYHRKHRDYQLDLRDERDHKSKCTIDHISHRAGQENITLKEEMKKERMLITVSRGLPPHPDVRVKEELHKELEANRSHSKVKVEDKDTKGKSSKGSREKGKGKNESSDSSDDNKGKTPKSKSAKKKKKKEKKKKRDKS
ncbi:uncharacterized protein si:ch211-195b21.5 isoform X1 [Acanthopagrus latus]|uniref:uncharacterized protein si:ch211-195b21.5 isoform X1 n=2 Tax=Acanthopagrus latus TaxID=8177 RepID=UPI00187BCDCD|nr:uncharacterized protein si:ch211-195b21.5 isoform X1 [Acanthopagrus latus]